LNEYGHGRFLCAGVVCGIAPFVLISPPTLRYAIKAYISYHLEISLELFQVKFDCSYFFTYQKKPRVSRG
jgi:hypothetical protein